jgi:hypothetical protein
MSIVLDVRVTFLLTISSKRLYYYRWEFGLATRKQTDRAQARKSAWGRGCLAQLDTAIHVMGKGARWAWRLGKSFFLPLFSKSSGMEYNFIYVTCICNINGRFEKQSSEARLMSILHTVLTRNGSNLSKTYTYDYTYLTKCIPNHLTSAPTTPSIPPQPSRPPQQ